MADFPFQGQKVDNGGAWDDQLKVYIDEPDTAAIQALLGEQQARILADLTLQGEIDGLGVSGLPPGGLTDQALLKTTNTDGDATWRAVTAAMVGAPTSGALLSEQTARTNADTSLQNEIDAIVAGGGTGDMLKSQNLAGLTDLVAAGQNLGLHAAAYRDIGTSSGDVASGDAPQAAVDAMPTVDVDSVAVPDDTSLKADFFTIGNVTYLRAGKLALLTDIAAGIPTATIWDAKGDLAVGTGADAAAKLTAGSNGQVLSADSTQTTGLKWITAGGTGDVLAANNLSEYTASQVTARANIGLVIGTNVQAFDSDLAAIAALTTTTLGRSRLTTNRSTWNGGAGGYTVLATDSHVAQTGTLSAPRTVTLPAASALLPGQRILLVDESGSPTEVNTITYNRAGSDTIQNEADASHTTALVTRAPYGKFEIASDGASKWIVVGHGLQRGAAYWQHPNDLAIPDDVYVPIPWNSPITDDQGWSPGFHLFNTTIGAASDGTALPTGTITVASTAGFPTSGFLVITGPPQTVTGVASTVATDLLTKTAHGFIDGQRVKVNGLTNTTGITNLTEYFVRDSAANTFKLALTLGGTAIDLTGADDTGLVFWRNKVDTVVGYTGTTGTTFTGCNTAATNVPYTNISTGTLKTGQVVTGANCRFALGGTPFIYNGIASVEWAANRTGRRSIRWASATAPFYFPGITEGPVLATGSAQGVIATMQLAAFSTDPGNSFVLAYQSSGDVLNVLTDGIQSPLLMIGYGTGR